MVKSKYLIGILVVLFLIGEVNALGIDVGISPSGTVSNSNYCGTNLPVTVTLSSSQSNWGGILCWYSTTDNPTKTKVSTTCLDPSDVTYSQISIPYPSEGTKDVTISFECKGYINLIGQDNCKDYYTINEPSDDTKTITKTISMTCPSMSFSISSSQNSISTYVGEQYSFTVTISNTGNRKMSCTSGSYNSQINIGSTGSFAVTGSKTSSGQHTVSVTCTPTEGSSSAQTKTLTVQVNVQANPAEAAISNAETAINDAEDAIDTAESYINSHKTSCVDMTSAENSITQAESSLSTAKTSLSTAKSTYSSKNYDSAKSQADQAKSAADSAKNYATTAKTTAQSAITAIESQLSSATSAVNDVSSNIDSATTAINTAKSEIADEECADTSTANQYITQAEDKLNSAKTDYASAQSSLTSCDFSNANSLAQTGKQKALDAKNYVTEATNALTAAIANIEKVEKEASDLLSMKQSKVNAAQTSITEAKNLRDGNIAILYGIDLTVPNTKLSDAESKVTKANTYFTDAQNVFNAGCQYSLAKDKALEASGYATDAESLADEAKNKYNEFINYAKTCEPQIESAESEVNEAQALYNKLFNLVEDFGLKYDINVEDTKVEIETEKGVLDDANDLLSKAKNKYDAGAPAECIAFAVDARDNAASANNKLHKTATELSSTIKQVLKDKKEELDAKVTETENVIKSASETYGSSGDKIVNAQESLTTAKSDLETAQSKIDEATSTEDLLTMLSATEEALAALNTAEENLQASKDTANGAKNDALLKVGATAFIVVGGAGAGFMWWKRRAKGTAKEDKTKKPQEKEKKEVKKEYKTVNYCPKCKEEKGDEHKFCHACGSKIKKKKVEK